MVGAIAACIKLTTRVSDSFAKIQITHIDQSQESEAVFLSWLDERNGWAVSAKVGKLLLLKRG
ncbi:hypothetical protein SMATCC274_30420 [Serratia marcescens]|nr:hypothetical protein SMATCC274_30420 [Serratia marcescens]